VKLVLSTKRREGALYRLLKNKMKKMLLCVLKGLTILLVNNDNTGRKATKDNIMKTSNINLLGSHLSDKNITFIAQDLLALDVAEKIAEIFGTPTDFIASARALLARFENEIDAKLISDARLMADHLKISEGKGTERTFADVPQTFVLRFPAVAAPVVIEAPAIVSELSVRTYVAKTEGRVIAVHQKNRDFKFCYAQRVPMLDSFKVYNFSSTEKLCLQGAKARWSNSTERGQAGNAVELKEIFTLSELKKAVEAVKAEAKRARQIWNEIAQRSPELVEVNSYGRKRLKCDLTAEAKITRAQQIWSEIKG
jgi:hypothetical protein